ncbi:hypothetical protein CDD83_3981 [Cordyceps sp. RAO-2017]|nr:hypothetical protein CDD83_3981 [Cordyceps sp. RAO-2017]
MVEQQQQYISPALPLSDVLIDAPNLTEGARSSSASSYYSSYDSNLLTPISAAASPPLQQIRKLMVQYPPPPGSPQAQEPTPPGSSKMYHHWNHFDMNGQPSSTSSPIGTPGHHVSQEFYMPEDRRTPGPPEQYLGMFGVSDPDPHQMPNHGHQVPNQPHPYFMEVAPMGGHHPMMGQSLAADPQHRDPGRPLPPGVPLLSHPPTHARHGRRPSTDNLGRPRNPMETPHPPGTSPRRRPVAGASRLKKPRSSRRQSAANRGPMPTDPAIEHKNCLGDEVPPTLKSTCPEEERCIFESRWRHRQQRGQDMWDSIQSDFTKRFNKTHGKEMLQMKFKRARSKYIEWLPKDEEILREAWKQMERERYQTLLETFHDNGGSRNMRLNASDIEAKVVNDMKLEESLYMESYRDLDIRRRRKVPAKKRQNGPHDDVSAAADDMMVTNERPSHNEDEVISQIQNRRVQRWEPEPSAQGDVVDMHAVWDHRAPMKMEPHPSLRMMNGAGGRNVYGPLK